jgi:tagatose 1,6-diphosphate aldolase
MTVTLTAGQFKHLQKLSDENNVISALAIDQRGSLKKMLAAAANKPADETTIVDFKKAVSEELTKYASAILLDPEYGLPAAKVRDPKPASCSPMKRPATMRLNLAVSQI